MSQSKLKPASNTHSTQATATTSSSGPQLGILVNGAQGRMGQLACNLIKQNPALSLITGTGRHDDLAQALLKYKPDVVLDLTNSACVWKNAQCIVQHGITPVIGTSGLSHQQIIELQQLASKQQLSGLIIPNFSIGAVLQMHYAAQLAKHFDKIEIIEQHHDKKLDAPSGTALATAQRINDLINKQPGSDNTIPIHAIRLPGVLAKQTVLFGRPAETLSIEHNVIDRAAFGPGIILACQKAKQFATIQYGLEHCLDLVPN